MLSPFFIEKQESVLFIPKDKIYPKKTKRNNRNTQRLLSGAGNVLHKAEFEAVARLCVIVVVLFSIGRSLCNHHLRI